MPALSDRSGRPVVHEGQGAGAISVTRDHAGQALGEHQALQRFEIRLHALGVHDQPFGDPLERVERAAGGVDQLGDGHKLGLPAAERALVLAERARQQRGHQAGRAHRGGQGLEAGHGVALVRHGAGAAHALRRRRLEHLADLGLGEQRDVARDLSDRFRDDRQLGHHPQQLVALVVPHARLVQVQAHRQAITHTRALAGEGVERTDGAAELDAQRPLARLGEAKPAAMKRRRPARDLQAGRDRRGRLHERPAEHDDPGVASGVAGQTTHRDAQDAVGIGQTGLEAQDQRGVEHVLARRAVVHEGRCPRVGASDVLGQRLDQRNGQRPRPLRFGGQCLGLQAQVRTDLGDDPRRVLGDDADLRFGAGQSALEVEHGAHERLAGERLGERVT